MDGELLFLITRNAGGTNSLLFTPSELDAIISDIAEHIPAKARSNALARLVDMIDDALYSNDDPYSYS